MRIQSSDASRVPRRGSWKKVVVGKVDFDTIAAAFVFGIGRHEEEIVLGRRASIKELKDIEILCIAAGGSGQTHLSNYDYETGTRVVFRSLVQKIVESGKWEIPFWRTNHVFDDAGLGLESEILRLRIRSLAEYIADLHEKGEKELWAQMKEILPPTLGSILKEMMAREKEPVEQFFKGIEILAEVIRSGQDPFGAIEGFEIYIGAARKIG